MWFFIVSYINKGIRKIMAVKYLRKPIVSGLISVIRYFDMGYTEPHASIAATKYI